METVQLIISFWVICGLLCIWNVFKFEPPTINEDVFIIFVMAIIGGPVIFIVSIVIYKDRIFSFISFEDDNWARFLNTEIELKRKITLNGEKVER